MSFIAVALLLMPISGPIHVPARPHRLEIRVIDPNSESVVPLTAETFDSRAHDQEPAAARDDQVTVKAIASLIMSVQFVRSVEPIDVRYRIDVIGNDSTFTFYASRWGSIVADHQTWNAVNQSDWLERVWRMAGGAERLAPTATMETAKPQFYVHEVGPLAWGSYGLTIALAGLAAILPVFALWIWRKR